MAFGIVKRIFFGSVFRIAFTLVLTLAVAAVGAFAAGIIGIPVLESVDHEFGEVTDEHTEIRTTLTVTNPNPIGFRSAEITADYTITMNGIEMARGGGEEIAVEPGTSTEQFTTRMDNTRIPDWWVTHLQNGERTDVDIDATVTSGALDRSRDVTTERTIETDLISSFDSDETRPIDANSPIVDDPVLYVNATRANWGHVGQEHSELDLRFDMYNPKSYDIPMTRLGYTITMNDVVVGEGETTGEHLLRSKQVTEVVATTRIDNPRLDDWWVTHLQNDEVTDLRIEFDARIQLLDTTITLPLDALAYEETIETDILGSNGETASSDQGTETASDDETEPEAETDSDSAANDSDATTDSEGDSPTDDTDTTGDQDDDGGILSGIPLSRSSSIPDQVTRQSN